MLHALVCELIELKLVHESQIQLSKANALTRVLAGTFIVVNELVNYLRATIYQRKGQTYSPGATV